MSSGLFTIDAQDLADFKKRKNKLKEKFMVFISINNI